MVWEPVAATVIHDETTTAKTFRFRLSHPSTHLAGQHYTVRPSAPDGYTAERSYSVASPPGRIGRERADHQAASRRGGLDVNARRG
jgi:ferredoxin-NADP reductase